VVEKRLTVCVVALNGKFVRPPAAAMKKDAVQKKRTIVVSFPLLHNCEWLYLT
jgi:hypothetical protein